MDIAVTGYATFWLKWLIVSTLVRLRVRWVRNLPIISW